MKNNLSLNNWAKEIASQNGFVIEKLIYSGAYYSPNKVRNLVFTGQYKNKPAVLKVYDDPRITQEPVDLQFFNQNNKSAILTAPKLLAHQMLSTKRGWFIMEKLPAGGRFFTSPLKPIGRQEFLKIFLEYRKNFPTKPNRTLYLSEQLPASEYHIFRINRWFQLANDKEGERLANGLQPMVEAVKFFPLYQKALDAIHQGFKKEK